MILILTIALCCMGIYATIAAYRQAHDEESEVIIHTDEESDEMLEQLLAEPTKGENR